MVIAMATWLLRIWLNDRPGSLGSVAVALGDAGVNLVGIEIVERHGPMAIDEIVVEASQGSGIGSIGEAIDRLRRVDGVAVEMCHEVDTLIDYDPRIDALEIAAQFAAARFNAERNGVLVQAAVRLLVPDWAVLFDRNIGRSVRAFGQAPPVQWLEAVLAGLTVLASDKRLHPSFGPTDLAWSTCGGDLSIVVGRGSRPFGSRERDLLDRLGRLHGAHRGMRSLTALPSSLVSSLAQIAN